VEINRELTELHGSRTGLMLRGRQFLAGTAIGDGTLVPSSAGIMTAGDFNGDGLSDVVVATVKPSNIEPTAICIAYGSPTGLVAGHHCLAEGRDGVPGAPRANGFGTAFAVGDLNGDHRDDLAIGTPDATSNGAVVVLYGSVDGLSAAGSTYLSAGASGVLGPRPHPASFAEQLTIGNITGSGAALIVAATGQGNQDTGAPRIMVFPGGPSGVRSTAAQRFIFDKGKPSEIISGDFDGDDHADLAVEEDSMLGPFKSAGQVNIMYGTAHGLTTRGQRVISPLSPALRFDPLAVKNPFALEFGISMGTMPTTGSPAASLIVGVPHDLGGEEGTSNAWVVILPGGRNGPDVAHRSIISAKQQSWAYVLSTGGNWPSY
jgi:hypothetical protein